MRHLHYYVVKLKLARAVWVPIGLLVLAIGMKGCSYAGDNITPRSVGVRGYHRSDGTYVRPHSRRPPGSRKHDEPFETLRVFSALAVIGGALGTVVPLWRFFWLPPGDLLPSLPFGSSPPERPTSERIPRRTAVGRKRWPCTGCSRQIEKGETYWYYETAGWHTERCRYCSNCHARLARDVVSLPSRTADYERAMAEWEAGEKTRWCEHFRSVYGCDP